MSKTINVGEVAIALEEYAIVANAILGIRNSGKTFLGKSIAEQLLEAQVPIVAFDPIGVWRHLRRPAGKRGKGFKIVVAGGEEPDLPLTPQSAPEIVRAAIRGNIPLVIDLYDSKLSKGDWRQIVRGCFRTLMYENRGVRHIFLEEAAEFVPQSVGRGEGDGQTYAEVEKVVRMGGNASLGITLINQRAQEVNKAVLDLSENLMLMRQRGQKAIEQLAKWVDHLDPDSAESIAAGMAKMATGDVWVFDGKADAPVLTRAPALRSFHPDRRRPELLAAAGKPADTGDFVSRMSGELAELIERTKTEDPAFLKKRVAELERENARLAKAPAAAAPATDKRELQKIKNTEKRLRGAIEALMEFIVKINIAPVGDVMDPAVLQRAIETAIASTTKAVEAKLESRNKDAEKLHAEAQRVVSKVKKLLEELGEPITINVDVRQNEPFTVSQRPAREHPSAPAVEISRGRVNGLDLPPAQAAILRAIYWTRDEDATPAKVGFYADYSPSSSTWERALAALRGAGLVTGLRPTPDGEALIAPHAGDRPAGGELHRMLSAKLPLAPRTLLDRLVAAGGERLSSEELATRAGYSTSSSTWERAIAKLRTIGAAEGYDKDGGIRAAEVFFS